MNDFLKKLQKADNETKKQWLIILTGAAMLVIIVVWLYYMNSVVFINPGETKTQETGTDFWPTLKTGVGITIDNITNGIKEKFQK